MSLQRKQEWQNTWSTIVLILSESHQDLSVTEMFFWICHFPLQKKKKYPKRYMGTLFNINMRACVICMMLIMIRTCSLSLCASIGITLSTGRSWMSCLGLCLISQPRFSQAAPSRYKPLTKQPTTTHTHTRRVTSIYALL